MARASRKHRVICRRRRVRWGPVVAVLAASAMLSGCPEIPVPKMAAEDSHALALVPLGHTDMSDYRAEFRKIFCDIARDHGNEFKHNPPCEEALHRLKDERTGAGLGAIDLEGAPRHVVFVVPGIFGECIASKVQPFELALAHLQQAHGYKTRIIEVSGRSSSAHNAKQIRDAILAYDFEPGEKAIVVGYSKGTGDILEALVNHPGIVDRIAAVVAVAGAVNGTLIADGLADIYDKLLAKWPLPDCPRGDGGGADSLTRTVRLDWIASNSLPPEVAYFSLPAFADQKNISLVLMGGYITLANSHPHNDSQVIFHDALIPVSTLLGYANADHWAVALPFTVKEPLIAKTLVNRNAYPREVLLEAIIRSVEEVLPPD